MKKAFLTGLALSACIAVGAAEPTPAASGTNAPTTTTLSNPEAASVLKTENEKFSYSIGVQFGNNIKRQQIDVSTDAVIRGLQDTLSGKTPLMTDKEIAQAQEIFRKDYQMKREAKMKEQREKNKKDAEEFFAANAKKDGVKTTPSGLQYKVDKEGNGPKPKMSDRVAVNYRGTLLDGKQFDASSLRGPEPSVLPVSGGMIKGWTEALTNMNVGSKWTVYIPAALGYGENGRPPMIEPNAALVFEIDLVDIKQPEPPPQPVTSDIIKVPSKAELDAGAQIERIKPEDLYKYTNKTANATNKAAAPKPGTK